MKKLLLLLLLAITANAQTSSVAPLMINKASGVVSNSTFFPANSNTIWGLILPRVNAERVLAVNAATGNDSGATGSNPTTPFLTIGAALTNAPIYSRVEVFPGYYALIPSYNSPDSTTAADFTYVPALLLNKTNVVVDGNGAVITGSGTGAIFGLLNTRNITIRGFVFDLTKGIGEELTNGAIGTVTLYGTNVNTVIEDCTFLNSTSHAITGSRNEYGLTIRNCSFQNIGSTNVAYVTNSVDYPYADGAAISGLGSDTVITGNKFSDNIRDVQWTASSGSTIHSGLLITANTFSNTIAECIFTSASNTNLSTLRNVNISGNVFTINQNEYAVNSRDSLSWLSAAIKMQCGSQVVIDNNSILNAFDYGIQLNAASPMEDFVISNNQIYGGTNGWTNSLNAAIYLKANAFNATNTYPLKGISIQGNMISHFGGPALRLMAANILNNGNLMFDCGKNADGQYVVWIGGNVGTSNIVNRANSYSDHKTTGQNFLFAVTDPAKSVYIDRSNIGRNIDTSLVSTPAYVESTIKSEVFLDGKTFEATLVGGTVTISHPLIHSGSRIQVTRNVTGGTPGHLSVSRSNETSFTVTSSSGTDTSTLAITVFEDFF